MDMIVSSHLHRRMGLLFVLAIVLLDGLSMPTAFGGVDNVVYQGSFPVSTASGLTQATLTINGNPRDLLIYRPSTAQSLPLLIFFDGTGSDLASIKSNDGYLRDYADTGNFIIAVPAQRVMSYGDWDNHSDGTPYWETAVGDSTSSAVSSYPDTNPDLLFTRAIIKEASVAYGADLTRVYVNGFSNGAFFSYFVAATLSDRIAAFAETGGGLVMNNTTAGEPTPCAPTASPAATGAVRSCTDAGWSVGLCSTSGAMARPIAPSSVARVPPGFMEANDDDDVVSFAHTCNLAYALPVSPNYQVRIVHSNGVGHSMNADYLDNSWNFLKNWSRNVTQNYSDSWWNANESGWGITITDHDANAFVQWYTYDQTGHNQKYVIPGGTFSSDKCQFSGAIQHVTGPSWTLPTFDPNQVSRTTVGSGTFDFCPSGLPSGTIVFNYTADGVTGSKQLTRLPFGDDVPHLGGIANTGAADFTDLWWNPAESGWGVSITQHGNNIFFRVFVYDTDGRPLLFVVPGVTYNSATSFTGAVQLTTGPWYGSNPFEPNQVARTTAGAATLTFSDANNGVLSYTVNGVTMTKSITRMVF